MRFELMPKQYFILFSYTFILFGTSICQYDRYGGSNHDQNHDRDRHQDRDRYDNKDRYNNHDRYGSGNQYGGSGQYGSGASAESCIEKAGYSVRTCEDTLIDRQREVKAKSTNAMDVQHGCLIFLSRLYRSSGVRAVPRELVHNSGHNDGPPQVGHYPYVSRLFPRPMFAIVSV
ncbi:unnamed protein product [Medioppia subpectinata]|uniref:Uncharacterized protein n=1 Tax=Medioppia subpectinata TaxID=1979941 RepID=A0A7R9QEV0_9ACAR|nr:unnamed protein product [Medioppia subpectinata]CAG2118793.1 unnamed protein product [Medioppia subpectinata]